VVAEREWPTNRQIVKGGISNSRVNIDRKGWDIDHRAAVAISDILIEATEK
jgi:hypothetical protein